MHAKMFLQNSPIFRLFQLKWLLLFVKFTNVILLFWLVFSVSEPALKDDFKFRASPLSSIVCLPHSSTYVELLIFVSILMTL